MSSFQFRYLFRDDEVLHGQFSQLLRHRQEQIHTVKQTWLPGPTGEAMIARRPFLLIVTITSLSMPAVLASAAELFPYSPPSATQQRPMIQRPNTTPELSAEERARISDLAAQAKKLSSPEQQQLRELLRKNLESAAKAKNWAQVQYYSEALHQLE